jgi:hypothetical protein
MKVTFFLPAGFVEWMVPPDAQGTFVFGALVKSIRADGFFMAPDLYLQHAAIVGMMFTPEGMTSPAAVTGMTKQ